MRCIYLILLLPLLLACGNVKRANSYDPSGGGITDLRSLLVGTWSRDDAEKNQIYTFKADGRAELRDFSAPEGGAIDRNGAYPQTLVFSFSGTYAIVGEIFPSYRLSHIYI